jgi:hypothetical protein
MVVHDRVSPFLRYYLPKGTVFVLVLHFLCGCFSVYQDPRYIAPPSRPASFEEYYSRGRSYLSAREEAVKSDGEVTQRRIFIDTDAGKTTIDYFQRAEKSDDLILVFPLLGGKNDIAEYFAQYFAHHGFETAIVHRTEDFKNPDNFDNLEEAMRNNVIRDRIALDYFEREYQKKKFGSFGISRGAINVMMTAGVDPRLKYNVAAMGGSDILRIFKKSNQSRLKKYRKTVMASKGINKDQFFSFVEQNLKTDPKYVSQYIDSRNTLLFLALFDRTVPIQYGRLLRKQVGNPKTIYLLADHYLSVLYTQFVSILPPRAHYSPYGIFPFDYVESESLAFYRKSMRNEWSGFGVLPFRILSFPFSVIANVIDAFTQKSTGELRTLRVDYD